MNLSFETKLADGYVGQSQIIRVLTEHWVYNQVYCPNCGHSKINKYENNRPVADFSCSICGEEFELKSKRDAVGTKVVDGAYQTMIERLRESHNPNLFLLNYDLKQFEVLNFLVIPKHFFVPDIIEKRKPLSQTAIRAGWVGCNIILQKIPESGKIFLIKNKIIREKEEVLAEWQKTLFLRGEKELSAKGWLIDIMVCLEKMGRKEFSLEEVYGFENALSKEHPDNRHIKAKIRQQLQILRDKGYLEFIERGHYRLL
jgi:type II restriction enzyme